MIKIMAFINIKKKDLLYNKLYELLVLSEATVRLN